MNKDLPDHFNRWLKVSPVAAVHFFISRGTKLFRELFVNASPALIGILVAVDDKTFWLGSAIGAITLMIITDVLILYFTYRYRIESDQLIIKHGLFTKQVLNIKFTRIQNINNSLPWYFKPFKLIRCIIDSAGSSAKETEIPGINHQRAEQITSIVQDYQKKYGVTQDYDELEEVSSSDNTTLKLSNWEVTKFGFTNSMIFVFAGAFFPIIEKLSESTGIDFSQWLNDVASTLPVNEVVAKILLVLLSMLLFSCSLLLITAIGAFIKFYNFELYDEGSKLKRIAGLFERQTVFLNKSKIQGVSIKQNLFARILGRVSIYYQQVHLDAQGGLKTEAFMIPMMKPDTWQKQLYSIYPDLSEMTLSFSPINRQYFYKRVTYLALLPVILPVLLLGVLVDWRLMILSVISLPIIGLIYLSYRKYGYMVLDDYLIIREGLFGTNFHILHRFKAQHICEMTSPAQRRLKLASVRVQMAYRLFDIPYIEIDEARKMINKTIYMTETSTLSWM